ncbi:MAG: HK97 gp10 family phage protein [Eubacteriales bacterium]|nr:HK97 gp10 family phage protein [Eubacteriales bacterium]
MGVLNTGDIEKELYNIFDDYTEEVQKSVQKACKKCAENTKDEIEKNIEKSGIKNRRGKYKKSWKVKRADSSNDDYYTDSYIVCSEEYRLTHLLENGHALPSGGRTRAFKHIAPAEEKAQEELPKLIEEHIKK